MKLERHDCTSILAAQAGSVAGAVSLWLIEAGKPYDLWIYPRKTHSLRGGATQLHLYRGLADYLKDHL